MKLLCLVSIAVLVAGIHRVESAGECGRGTTPDNEAFKLIPCASAAKDENASVSQSCCAQVKKLGQSPSCLCAVMLSNVAKMSGANPQIAVTIPKRCNLANRPVGYKCGRKLLTTLCRFCKKVVRIYLLFSKFNTRLIIVLSVMFLTIYFC